MTESFDAVWSRLLKVVSGGATAILLGVTFLAGRALAGTAGATGWLISALPPTILVVSLFFTIRGYELEGAELRVKRLLWNTVIGLDGLRSVDADPEAMSKSIRTFGNGGLFSFSGFFRNKKLGSYRAFVTDSTNAVVLRWGERTVVVSPSEPEAFANRVRESRRLSS